MGWPLKGQGYSATLLIFLSECHSGWMSQPFPMEVQCGIVPSIPVPQVAMEVWLAHFHSFRDGRKFDECHSS